MNCSPTIKTLVAACTIAAPIFTLNLHAQTSVTWNPGATSPAYWNDPANWGGTVPGPGYKAFFNGASAEPCIVNSAAGGCQISMGDGGGPVTLIVTNGGDLSAGDTSLGNN